MKADIIVRAKNNHDLTRMCIGSIHESTPRDDYRLIVVDDGSNPPLESDGDVSIRFARSRGAVTATNAGLGVSLTHFDTEYVVVMDNDTRVPVGDVTWLDRFISALEQCGPRCAAVGATTNYANPPQHILTVPQVYVTDWGDESRGGSRSPAPAPWFVSFCVLLRKSVVRNVGLWDTRYDPGNWEDTDYAMQLRTSGYYVTVAPSVYIHHDGHKTFSSDLKTLLKTNKLKFIEKWGLGRLFDLGIISGDDMKAML